jgi:CheY-like chemotaxis protein
MPNNFFSLPLKEDRKDFNIFNGLTIVVVDDNEDILVLVTYILESYGIQVLTASSALAAFKIIQQFRIDILISDIAMSEEDGYSLIQKIRSSTQTQIREMPAIAFTGCVAEQVHEKVLASGFQTYILKPCSEQQLITEIAKLVKSSYISSFLAPGNVNVKTTTKCKRSKALNIK